MKLESLSDMIESNGKTVRQNNLEKKHNIPLGTLVEINSACDSDFAWAGVRMYVSAYGRDCDGTPLYTLGPKGECEFHCVGGFGEDNLVVVQAASTEKE